MRNKSKFVALFIVFIITFQLFFQSETIKVIAATQVIKAPVVSNPDQGEIIEYDDLKVRWGRVSEANYYKIGLRDVTLDKKIISEDTSENYYLVDKEDLKQGHRYKVAVGAYQDEQNFKWAEPIYFTVENEPVPERPNVKNPLNNSIVKDLNMMVNWDTVKGATKYKVALRNLRTDKVEINEWTGNRVYVINNSKLTPGDEYRLAVGAFNNDNDFEGAWTELYFTVEEEPVPLSPNIRYPQNDSVVKDLNMLVRWDKVNGATKYKVALRNLRTDKIEINTMTTINLYSISNSKLTPGDEYRLAVGAFNNDNNFEGAWTELYFTVENEPVPERPNVKNPLNNSIVKDLNMLVRWDRVNGATKYKVALRNLRTDKIEINEWTGNRVYSISNSKLTPGDEYRLAVGAFNNDNNFEGAWTELYFTVEEEPVPLSPNVRYPQNNSVVKDLNMLVRWDKVNGATKYKVALRNLRTDKVEINTMTTINLYSISNSKLTPGDEYRLAVGAFNNDNDFEGAWTELYFTVEEEPVPLSPNIRYPQNDSVVKDLNMLVRWDKVNGATKYKVALRNMRTDKVEINTVTTNNVYNISNSKLTPGDEYRLAVGAFNNDNNFEGAWTELYFTVENEPVPERPNVKNPLNNSIVKDLNMLVRWDRVNGATKYKVALRNLRTDKIEINTMTTTNVYSISNSKLTPGDEYRLAVGAFNNDNNFEGAWTELYFTVENEPVPERPNVKNPLNNSIVKDLNMLVRWDRVNGATKYKVALRNLRTDKIEINTMTTSNVYNISNSKLAPGDEYRLAVGAFNNDNNFEGAWTELYFTVENEPIPDKPNVRNPQNNSVVKDSNMLVMWNKVEGATKYKVALRNLRTDKIEINTVTTNNVYNISNSKLTPGDEYRLAVGAFNNDKDFEGAWTELYFTVENEPIPDKPNVRNPQNNSVVKDSNMLVMWNKVEGATKYKVALRNLRTDKVEVNTVTTNNVYSISNSKLIPGDEYRLAVGAFNNDNNFEGAWTELYFTVENDELEDIELVNPKENEQLPFENVRIKWDKVERVKEYRIKVYEKEVGKEILSTTTSSSYITLHKSKIKEGMNYRIDLIGVDEYKNETRISREFSIVNKNKPILKDFNLDNKTLKLNERFEFEGYVYGIDKYVDIVTINIKGPNQKQVGKEYFRKTNISNKKYSLTNIPEIKAGEGILKEPGDYWIHIWAKIKGGEGVLLGEKKISVGENTSVNRVARENLMKLANTYPVIFKYDLELKDEYDDELKKALLDFVEKYELTNKYSSFDELYEFLNKAVIGELKMPWAGNRNARTNLMKLCNMYPEVFEFKLAIDDTFDDYLNDCLLQFVYAFELEGSYYTLEELEYYLYQAINDIMNIKVTYSIEGLLGDGSWTEGKMIIKNGTRLRTVQNINGKFHRIIDNVKYDVASNNNKLMIMGNVAKVMNVNEKQNIRIDVYKDSKQINSKSLEITIVPNELDTIGEDKQKESVTFYEEAIITLYMNNPYMLINDTVVKLDESIAVTPIIVDNDAYIPIEEIINLYGGSVDFDDLNGKFKIYIEDNIIQIASGIRTILVNNQTQNLKLSPFMLHGQLYVPIEFFVNYLGSTIEWDSKKQITRIYTNREYSSMIIKDNNINDAERIVNTIKMVNNINESIRLKIYDYSLWDYAVNNSVFQYKGYYDGITTGFWSGFQRVSLVAADGIFNNGFWNYVTFNDLTKDRAEKILISIISEASGEIESTRKGSNYLKYKSIVAGCLKEFVVNEQAIFTEIFEKDLSKVNVYIDQVLEAYDYHYSSCGRIAPLDILRDSKFLEGKNIVKVDELIRGFAKNQRFLNKMKKTFKVSSDVLGYTGNAVNILTPAFEEYYLIQTATEINEDYLYLLDTIAKTAEMKEVRDAAQKLKNIYTEEGRNYVNRIALSVLGGTMREGADTVIDKVFGFGYVMAKMGTEVVFAPGSLTDHYDKLRVLTCISSALKDEVNKQLSNVKSSISYSQSFVVGVENIYKLLLPLSECHKQGENTVVEIMKAKFKAADFINKFGTGESLRVINRVEMTRNGNKNTIDLARKHLYRGIALPED